MERYQKLPAFHHSPPLPTFTPLPPAFPLVEYSSDYLGSRSSHCIQRHAVSCQRFQLSPARSPRRPMQPTIFRLMILSTRWCRYQLMIRAQRSTICSYPCPSAAAKYEVLPLAQIVQDTMHCIPQGSIAKLQTYHERQSARIWGGKSTPHPAATTSKTNRRVPTGAFSFRASWSALVRILVSSPT